MLRATLKWLFSGAAFLALFGFVLWLGQRRMMYFPERANALGEALEARNLGLRPWLNSAGTFMGWRGGPPGGLRVLLCPGNGGKALQRAHWLPRLEEAHPKGPVEVLLLEYPGYGTRDGNPSQTTLVAAAREGLDALWMERREPVLLLGESIGSGVAALVAGQRSEAILGLLMVTPLPSMREVARLHYPLVPGFLIRDTYPAQEAIRGLRRPMALLLAERDEIIPMALGKTLAEGYSGPVRIWVEVGAEHNTLRLEPKEGQLREALGFLLAGH